MGFPGIRHIRYWDGAGPGTNWQFGGSGGCAGRSRLAAQMAGMSKPNRERMTMALPCVLCGEFTSASARCRDPFQPASLTWAGTAVDLSSRAAVRHRILHFAEAVWSMPREPVCETALHKTATEGVTSRTKWTLIASSRASHAGWRSAVQFSTLPRRRWPFFSSEHSRGGRPRCTPAGTAIGATAIGIWAVPKLAC